jgi:hypothetical protein
MTFPNAHLAAAQMAHGMYLLVRESAPLTTDDLRRLCAGFTVSPYAHEDTRSLSDRLVAARDKLRDVSIQLPELPNLCGEVEWEAVQAAAIDKTESDDNPPLALEVIPGGIRYGRTTVDLSGKPLACIRELLDAHGHRLDWTKLRDRVWGQDSYTEAATIKNAIADARDALRKLARQAGKRINGDFDPLPCVGRGKDLAWKLDFPE